MKKFSYSLQTLTQPIFGKRGLEGKILGEWKEIVGEELAQKTKPVSAKFSKNKSNGGVLKLKISPADGLEMQHSEELIIEKIATYFGYKAIATISFQQYYE